MFDNCVFFPTTSYNAVKIKVHQITLPALGFTTDHVVWNRAQGKARVTKCWKHFFLFQTNTKPKLTGVGRETMWAKTDEMNDYNKTHVANSC